MLHYNFPPYCVGETGFIGSPKRREIGHGKLARRGVQATLPNMEEFPYVVRVVSEITESNGSSSMASGFSCSSFVVSAGCVVGRNSITFVIFASVDCVVKFTPICTLLP